MGGSIGGTIKRAATAGITGGLSEFSHGNDAFGLKTGTDALGLTHKSQPLAQVPSMQNNPAQTLAQTGGAPLLANVAMGASVEDSIAGYFGQSDYKSWFNGLSDSDKSLVQGVSNQLTSIQSNTNLRNTAVQNIVNDFPNIAAQAATARQAAGGEFDDQTKSYMDLALNQSAAKYAAGGNLSSGSMVEASAKVGAGMAMNKLDYMNNRGDTAYNQGVQGWQARYNEANSLRNFQNTMTQGAAGQGFSAVQAALNRNQQADIANAGYQNQQNLANQASDNQLFGAIGGLAGTVVGGSILKSGMNSQAPQAPQAPNANYGFPSGSSYGSPYGSFSGEPSLNLNRNGF